MTPAGVPGLLTSESGQGGDWLGAEAVVPLLLHQCLCPQTHPVRTAGVRDKEKRPGPSLGSPDPWESSDR